MSGAYSCGGALRNHEVRDFRADISPDVRFADRFGLVGGIDELFAHLAAVHVFMPGMRLSRVGEVRHCQGKLLVGFSAVGVDGKPRGSGSNMFVLDADGRIEDVTGFWQPS
jgi:hypothetical protein